MSAYAVPQALPQFSLSSFSMAASSGGSAYPPPSLSLPVFEKSAFPATDTAVVEAVVPASFTNTQIGTGLLNTNNIQPLTSASVSLYTLVNSVINFGASIVTQLNISSAWIQMFSPIYYFYNTTSTQLWSTRFYPATNAITTIFYADTTTSQPSASFQAKPSTVGDTTPYNGWFAMGGGKLSMIFPIRIDLESSNHYLYNTAKTMYKQLFYGAGGNIYETYYGDTTTATSSADVQITPFAAGNTVISNGNFIVTSGAFKALSKRFTQLESPRHNLYNAAVTMYKSVFYGGSTTINEEFYADSSRPTVSTVTVLAAPVGSTPLVANTGTYQITSGTTTFESSAEINMGTTMGSSGVINIGSPSSTTNLNCPLTPIYTPVATNGTSVGEVGYTYYQTTVTAGTFLTNVITTSLSLTNIPAGIWFVYAVVPIRCTVNNTLTYYQVAITDNPQTTFYALSSSFCSHNPPANGDAWYSCSGIAVLTATKSLIATIKMTFNVVGAYTRFGQFARLSATRIA